MSDNYDRPTASEMAWAKATVRMLPLLILIMAGTVVLPVLTFPHWLLWFTVPAFLLTLAASGCIWWMYRDMRKRYRS